MELDERAEETLETLWVQTLEERKGALSSEQLDNADEEILGRLVAAGYLTRANGAFSLTEKGRLRGEDVVRRHRLAERLLTDVLSAAEPLMHETACKFEHLLGRGLDENICSLLGHPRVCPHGKAIPPGQCCRELQSPQRIVSRLSTMSPGQRGTIAYVYAPQSGELQKLMSMGVLPGAPITLLQRFPSYVFQLRQAQFAVDRDIAEAIYVRLGEGRRPRDRQRGPVRRGFWGRLGRRGRQQGAAAPH